MADRVLATAWLLLDVMIPDVMIPDVMIPSVMPFEPTPDSTGPC
jgi:hypothetical protein